MANRRMFSLDVVDTDVFLDMPTSTQCLYFQLVMRADDDGFVSSPKRITNMVGCNTDDLKLLIAKGFIGDYSFLIPASAAGAHERRVLLNQRQGCGRTGAGMQDNKIIRRTH